MATALAAIVLAGAAAAPADAQRGGGTSGTVNVSEGTNLAVAASPDGQTLVIDLQGVLWRLPAAGGAATRLTSNVDDPRVTTLYTPFQLEELRANRDAATSTDQTGTRVGLERSVGILRRILDAGGRVLAGTDIPLDPVAVDLHLNLRAMVRYGISPYDALRTATRIPARQLGVDRDIGTVRPGKLADLAFVEGNPLTRIEDAANVRMVMSDGRLRSVEQLLALFPRG